MEITINLLLRKANKSALVSSTSSRLRPRIWGSRIFFIRVHERDKEFLKEIVLCDRNDLSPFQVLTKQQVRRMICGVTGMQDRGFGEVHNPSDASSFDTSRAKLIFLNLKFSMLPIGM